MASNTAYTNGKGEQSDNQAALFTSATELADLGRERFDHDTAAIGDRDDALWVGGPVTLRQGRAPAGMEAQIFAWNTYQFEETERDGREELKGDLHGGQLHRQNRVARGEPTGPPPDSSFARREGANMRGGAQGGRRRRGGMMAGQGSDGGMAAGALVAGRKPDFDAPPLAKNFAEELDKDFFWSGPIV